MNMESTETPQIYARIAAIMKATKEISKGRENKQQNFKFRGIDDVMNELHDVFAENGVFVLTEVMDYTTDQRPTKTGGMSFLVRAKIRFRYMATDGSSVETVNVGEAMDSGDKAFNKAMSIALKYSLLQMLLIPTEDTKDPDAETPEETDCLAIALQEIRAAQSVGTLNSIYNSYPMLLSDTRFTSALTERKNQLKNGTR